MVTGISGEFQKCGDEDGIPLRRRKCLDPKCIDPKCIAKAPAYRVLLECQVLRECQVRSSKTSGHSGEILKTPPLTLENRSAPLYESRRCARMA